MKYLISLLICAVVVGCGGIRGKGGTTKTTLPGVTATANQPENPKDATTQSASGETEETYVVPAGSTIEQHPEPSTVKGVATTNAGPVVKITLSEPMPVVKKTKHTADTTIGASQKDEIGSKIAAMKSFRWLQILGAAVFLFGVGSAVYPPLKVIVGGNMTTSAVIAVAGLLLIFLPPFFVEHEVLIFSLAIGGAIAWIYIHSHGNLKGQLQSAEKYIQNIVNPPTPPPAS